MVNRYTALKIRKTHRYLGLFLGIQFLFWTISGLYFSWTDIDDIHGDHFKNLDYQPQTFNNLISPSQLNVTNGIKHVKLDSISENSYSYGKTYPFERLLSSDNSELPPDVDPTKKEDYLSDDQFLAKFGMDKEAFKLLPQWKKVAAKKKIGLF